MASIYKQKQKRKLIAAIVCCVLVFAMIVSTVIIGLVHKASLYEQFEDRDFAAAIAESLGLSSRYSLTQEDLDKYEGLVYFCNVGVDSTNGYASYAYPVVMLCDKDYTNALIEQSDPDYEAPETADETDYSKNIVAVPYVLTDPSDLNMFRNLRLLRAFDVSELNEMSQNCYTTQLYNMYGLGTTAYNVDTLIQATKLSGLTSLDQIASLDKLEHLSLCYTGITTLDGIDNFPNLKKLDTTYTALEDISALKDATNLTYLAINSINVTETEEEEHDHDHDHDHSDEASKEESSDESSDTSDEESEEEEKEEEKKEPTYNETGLTNEDLAVLSNLQNLVYLDITNNNVSDLSSLSTLQNIKYLSVANNPITSLTGAENLKNMKVLYAIDCRLGNIDAVKGFDKLETVYLGGNLLTDLSALSSATKVTYLDAADNELTNASAVAGMTELGTLALSGNKLTAAPDLSKLNKVTSVDLSGNEISDVSGLEKFNPTDFEVEKDEDGKEKESSVTITLNLSDNKIQSLKLSASKLTSLDLSENSLVSADSAAFDFDGCTALTTLTLTKNEKLTSLDGIEKLTGLTTLTADETGIILVPSLEKLDKLATVNLSGSSITDLSGLKNNKGIKTLTLKECVKLTDISVLSTMSALTTVDFTKCEALTNESIAKAFGTPKTDDKKAELVFDAKSKLTVTLTGCKGVTEFAIFNEYGDMKVTYDKKSETK